MLRNSLTVFFRSTQAPSTKNLLPKSFFRFSTKLPENTRNQQQDEQIPLVEWKSKDSTKTPDSKQIIEERLRERLQASNITIYGYVGCGAQFSVELTSPQFKGKTLLAQHRLVTGALKDLLQDVHSISIKTNEPTEN
eukprot:TRINITY_DN12025_c0_g1_i1.p1 TRINITY_DN12025_c0_g1~~TRINITY_DN12025_c0_g1_i1.p1  ORF type:complete len:137 (-),score=19.38 TRINITY_DN12025_c0_g1_i1:88-498(-)